MKVSLGTHDVCLSDYWLGTSGPFLSIPVSSEMTGRDINRDLVSELNGNGLYGREDWFFDIRGEYRQLTGEEKTQLNNLVRESVSNFVLTPNVVNPFGLEKESEDNSEFDDGPYLYLNLIVDFE